MVSLIMKTKRLTFQVSMKTRLSLLSNDKNLMNDSRDAYVRQANPCHLTGRPSTVEASRERQNEKTSIDLTSGDASAGCPRTRVVDMNVESVAAINVFLVIAVPFAADMHADGGPH